MSQSGGGPLAGIRVIDMTSVLMGPYTTQLLGDMGADVIKVESPNGDTSRGIGPMRNAGMGAGFLHVNRNKRAIAIDLKHAQGHGILLALLKTADVLVYNVRPAAMKRLRLTWDDLRPIKPDLIHTGVVGYGQDGPYAARPAYDDLIQGAIGLPSLLAEISDGVPRYVPLAFVDRTVALAAANAICAALFQRERTGQGQALEVPMFETMVPFVLGEHMAGQTFDPPLGPVGYPRLLAPQRRPFQTADGYLCAVIYTDQHWRRFYAMTGRSAAFDADPRLHSLGSRTRHMAALGAETAAIFRTNTTAHWLQQLGAADIPCMRLNEPSTLRDDPHLRAVRMFEHSEHPSEGPIVQMRYPVRSSLPGREQSLPTPRLGEHTRALLAEAGYTATQINQLIESGAVFSDR